MPILVAVYHGPVVLDFVTGKVSPQMADAFVEPANLTNDNGKRSIDVSLQNVLHENDPVKKPRRQFRARMFFTSCCFM